LGQPASHALKRTAVQSTTNSKVARGSDSANGRDAVMVHASVV
jgi:hypothetical protein